MDLVTTLPATSMNAVLGHPLGIFGAFMIAFVAVLTLCTVTVPTSDPLKDPVFTQCEDKVTHYPYTLAGRELCLRGPRVMMAAALNQKLHAEIRKATKFPFVSSIKGVKTYSCKGPVVVEDA